MRRAAEGQGETGQVRRENECHESRRGFVAREERELCQYTGVAKVMSAGEGTEIERRDEKLDVQICPDYYEIARLRYSGAHFYSFFMNFFSFARKELFLKKQQFRGNSNSLL